MSKGDAAEKAWQARGYCTLASDEIGPHEQMAFFDGRASLEPLVEHLVEALKANAIGVDSCDCLQDDCPVSIATDALAAAREQGFGG